MAPKSSAGKEKLIGDEDEVLQAVILADSFNSRFKPLTTRKPRVRPFVDELMLTMLFTIKIVVSSARLQCSTSGLDL
jgi:hypothetical protein